VRDPSEIAIARASIGSDGGLPGPLPAWTPEAMRGEPMAAPEVYIWS